MLPRSHGVHGLPQAAPSDEQHWDFRVAPLIFISHLPSTMFCQQVPFTVSDWKKPQCIVTQIAEHYILIYLQTLNHEKKSPFIVTSHIRSKFISKALNLSFSVLDYSLKSSQHRALANPHLCLLPLTGNISAPL